MRWFERDILLLTLAVAAGSADGWSYFGLGHAFVANMTGNTALLGIAVFLQRDALHPSISLGRYVAGSALRPFSRAMFAEEMAGLVQFSAHWLSSPSFLLRPRLGGRSQATVPRCPVPHQASICCLDV